MSLGADLKRLGGQTLVYGLGTVLVRAATFLMLPVYTRHLTKEDYGLVALATALSSVLLIVFPLGLHSAVNRLYTDAQDEEGRLDVLKTLSLATWAVGASMVATIEIAGGWTAPPLSAILPYDPYARLAVWGALFTSVSYVPVMVLQMRQRPVAYVALAFFQTAAVLAFTLHQVVFRSGGAEGYLRGALWGGAVGALPAVWIVLREGRPRIRPELLRRAFAYGWPIVLHQAAAWILALSDRLILERFLTLQEVGLYAVAFQVAAVVTVAGYAMNAAWNPYMFSREAEEGTGAAVRLARLTTYFACSVTWIALGVALGARDLVFVLTAPAYREAQGIVPWLAAGQWLGALYLIPSGLLFVRSRTGLIPWLTVAAGACSVTLNLLLVPRFGMVAAGWASVGGNAVLLLLVWAAARRVFPLPYETGRLLRILVAASVVYAAGRWIPEEPRALTLAARLAVWLSFPLALAATGFLNPPERARLAAWRRQRPSD